MSAAEHVMAGLEQAAAHAAGMKLERDRIVSWLRAEAERLFEKEPMLRTDGKLTDLGLQMQEGARRRAYAAEHFANFIERGDHCKAKPAPTTGE